MDRLNLWVRWARTLLAVLALASPLALATGCGGDVQEKGLVPVKGRVTLDGGPWPKEGQILFAPVAAGASGSEGFRPGSGKFGLDGNYSASAFEGNTGLYPGKYEVSVECWEEQPGMDTNGKPTGKSAVPKKYQTPGTSGLTLTVQAGVKPEADFDLKSK